MREAILDAAERRLTRYGYGKMTMSDLAEEAGIGVGTTYLHFPGKAEVALAVISRANLQVIEEQRKITASDGPVENRLREVLTQRILIRYERVRQHTHTLEELRVAIQRQKGLAVQAVLWRDLEIQIIVDLLMEGRASGVFRFDNAEETAEAMLGATDAFMPRNLRPEDFEPANFEPARQVPERVGQIIRLLLRGVRCSDTFAEEV